jgi:hypothetical protein
MLPPSSGLKSKDRAKSRYSCNEHRTGIAATSKQRKTVDNCDLEQRVNISWRNVRKDGSSTVNSSWTKTPNGSTVFVVYGSKSESRDQEFAVFVSTPVFERPYTRNSSHFPNKRVWGATGNDTLSRMLNMINAPKLPIWLMACTWLASPSSHQPRVRYLTPTITY